MFILIKTWGGEVGFDGILTAITHADRSDTLETRSSRHAFHLLAIVALRAGVIQIAGATAKAKPIRVFHTRSRGIPKATVSGFTGEA
jgi:hypothetical protein